MTRPLTLKYLLVSVTLFHSSVILPCILALIWYLVYEEVQVGKDQEKAQSEKDSHSKNRGGKKPN